jgi:NADH-quinone oxidoreductase subunit K
MTGHALILSAALFAVGAFGVLARRNLLIVLMSAELMLNGVNVALLAFARQHANPAGHVLVLLVMAVAAAEVAVGLAIVISVFRNRKTVDTGDLDTLKG